MTMSLKRKCGGMALAVIFGLAGPSMAQELNVQRLPDPTHGEALFKTCRQCHAVVPGEVKIGPSLAGVIGRRPGSVPGFGYSEDMINFGRSGAAWTLETLDRFLTRPRAVVPGTKMVFPGFRKLSDREDMIAFLMTLRG